MASGFGRIIAPSRSVYGVSKWGVEGFATCLRYEMKQWGVKVTISIPYYYSYFQLTSLIVTSQLKQLQKSDTSFVNLYLIE